jgi:hypothetical protein
LDHLVQETPGFDIPYYAELDPTVKRCFNYTLMERMVREFNYDPNAEHPLLAESINAPLIEEVKADG